MVSLIVLTVLAVIHGRLESMISFAGAIYMIMSLFFLGVMVWAFVSGHIGGPTDIERPKMSIFALENLPVISPSKKKHNREKGEGIKS